ncbi:hypothetical protein PMIN03_007860 [Paraphaeosphaeria minitans]
MESCAGLSSASTPPQSFSLPVRITKVYTSCLVLLLYTTFSFAAEYNVHPNDWRLINGYSYAEAKRDTENCDIKDDMCFKPINMKYHKADSDSFDPHGNDTLAHEHKVAMGIAQDLFYELNEENWENARPYDLLRAWSEDSNNLERYHLEKRSRPHLTMISYYTESLTGWKDMHCDAEYDDGCRNMPTQDYILAHFSQERHRARQLKFSLIAIQRYYIQGYTFTKVLNSAKKRLDGHCEEFTRIFFHKATHHKGQKCPDEILNIVVQVILSVVSLFFMVGPMVDLAVWGLKEMADNFLQRLIQEGATGLVKAMTRGLPAAQIVGGAGALIPAWGELVVPAVDTALLVAKGGAQVVNLADTVAASTAELTFDSAEKIAQLVKAEAIKAAQAPKSAPPNAIKPISPPKSRPKIPKIKKPSPEPLPELEIGREARLDMQYSWYQDIAENLLDLPRGRLAEVDLAAEVGPDLLQQMFQAELLENDMELAIVAQKLQLTRLSENLPQYDGPSGSGGESSEAGALRNGRASTSSLSSIASIAAGSFVYAIDHEMVVLDEKDSVWKVMQEQEWVSYKMWQYEEGITKIPLSRIDEMKGGYHREWQFRMLLQQGKWTEVLKNDRWEWLDTHYKFAILQESLPPRITANVDWSRWTIRQLTYHLLELGDESRDLSWQLPRAYGNTPVMDAWESQNHDTPDEEDVDTPFGFTWQEWYPTMRPLNSLAEGYIPQMLTAEALRYHRKDTRMIYRWAWYVDHRRWDFLFQDQNFSLLSPASQRFFLYQTLKDHMISTMDPFFRLHRPMVEFKAKLQGAFPPIPGQDFPGPHPWSIAFEPPRLVEFYVTPSKVLATPPSWSENVRKHIKKIWQAIKKILGLSKPAKRQDSFLTVNSGKSHPRTTQNASALQLWSVGGVFRKDQGGPNIQPAVAGFTKMPSEGVPWKPTGQIHAQENVPLQQVADVRKANQLLLSSALNGGEVTAGLLAKTAMEHPNVLGVMTRLESFSVDDLTGAPGDGTSVYHQIHINSTSFFTTDAARTVAEHVMERNSSLERDHVVRSTIEFLLVARDDSVERINEPVDGAQYLGSRIARRLVRANGSPMTPGEAQDFLVQYGSTISAYRTELARDNGLSNHINMDLPPENSQDRDFTIVAGPGETSWLDILGGIDVVGMRSESSHEKGAAELQVRTNTPLTTRSTHNGKRSTGDPDRPVAHALIIHQLEAMRGTIHARFLGGMRLSRKRDVSPPITRDGNTYKVLLRKDYFHNEIKSKKGLCSIDEYTGDQTKNLRSCHEFLDDAVDPVLRKIGYSMKGMDNVEDWESGGMAPFVHLVMVQFPSYEMVKRTAQLQSQHDYFETKLFERLKNSLVAKAWADESCFVKCTPASRYYKREEVHHIGDDLCRAVCYDRTKQRAEDLYGLDSATGFAAEYAPWNLNETEIMAASRHAYINHGTGSILPGSINLNPYDAVYEDIAPPLPVCRSELVTVSASKKYHKGASTYPCTCGDKYGNETLAFMQAAPASWQGHGEKQESRILETCLKDKKLVGLAKHAPAAYLNNFCQILYSAIAPPGAGSFMELRQKGHYTENQNMCKYVTNFVRDNKDRGDEYLNDGVCKIWASQAKDFHRNFRVNIGAFLAGGGFFSFITSDKHRKDFSDINSKLGHGGGCHGYRHWWDHDCDEGKNWQTCGMPCPDYGYGKCLQ